MYNPYILYTVIYVYNFMIYFVQIVHLQNDV